MERTTKVDGFNDEPKNVLRKKPVFTAFLLNCGNYYLSDCINIVESSYVYKKYCKNVAERSFMYKRKYTYLSIQSISTDIPNITEKMKNNHAFWHMFPFDSIEGDITSE